jgi:glycosyltransferase involved in cell wall biosynthesis
MRISVIVNNFNYQQYVIDAVNSVLNQSTQVDEIVVVDDGSTDQSSSKILQKFSDNDRVKIILKEKNEGQLSCLNEGARISTGDIIFFLDSDDLYAERYIAEAVAFYRENTDCDFLFCGYTSIGDVESQYFPYPFTRNLGYSIVSTLYQQRWIGSVTSTISMRKAILDKVLPIPFLDDWRTRADDCLIWGASLAGAKKFYMSEALVKYRIHNQNNFYHQKFNESYLFIREVNIRRLLSFLSLKMNYGNQLFNLAALEFSTIEAPFVEELWCYVKIILLANANLYTKFRILTLLLKHFLTTRIKIRQLKRIAK